MKILVILDAGQLDPISVYPILLSDQDIHKFIANWSNISQNFPGIHHRILIGASLGLNLHFQHFLLFCFFFEDTFYKKKKIVYFTQMYFIH